MDDDIRLATGAPSRSSRATFTSEIRGILQHSNRREAAKDWARNLRFLTFDEGTLNAVPPVQTDTQECGQCKRCAERLPVPSGHKCGSHDDMVRSSAAFDAWEEKLHSYPNPCAHVEDLTCSGCRHIPLFPNVGHVSRFRLRRARKWDDSGKHLARCNHFVAVSYCWESQVDNEMAKEAANQPYTVIEEDGTERAMRTPRGTINRVVRFAIENGFRMIWIDQVLSSSSSRFPLSPFSLWCSVFQITDIKHPGLHRSR